MKLLLSIIFFLCVCYGLIKSSSFFRKMVIKRKFYNLIKTKKTISEINRLIQSSVRPADYIGEVSDLDPDLFLLNTHAHKNTNEEISKYFYALYLYRLIKIYDYMIIISDDKTLSLYKDHESMGRKGHGLIKDNDQIAFNIENEINQLIL